MSKNTLSKATKALHADRMLRSDDAISPTISQSVTYRSFDSSKFVHKATQPNNPEFYGRHGNPNAQQLAKIIADLEGAKTGLAFASGMGAITSTILTFVNAGDHIIAQHGHYSATVNFLSNFLARFDIKVSFVDQTKPDDFEVAIRPNTKLIFVETPTNPLGEITDLSAVAGVAKSAGILSICDNTLASPINQRPITNGIDLVAHSATKYIGGHHDLLAGVVVGSRRHINQIWQTSMDLGPIGAPFDAWLAVRGLRTLKARMDLHNSNALEIATFLEQHSNVRKVYYPGLTSHPQHALAQSQMDGFGGVMTFELEGDYDAGHMFMSKLTIFQNAASFGGIESLAVQPAAMFRARLSDDEIKAQGISPSMIRLSVGIEDIDDLINDLAQALT